MSYQIHVFLPTKEFWQLLHGTRLFNCGMFRPEHTGNGVWFTVKPFAFWHGLGAL